MDSNVQELLVKIKRLEQELVVELQKKEKEYFYEVLDKKVRFQKEVKEQNRRFVKAIHRYLGDASLRNILTIPVVWACLVPALFMDLVVSIFQMICFPVYSIPKVKRHEYIIIDRQYLSYLNLIEKINCCYCGYFGGLIGYVQEIAARTEQYWCPIKHAHRIKMTHSRYKNFLDYGDGERFRAENHELRTNFDDLEESKSTQK